MPNKVIVKTERIIERGVMKQLAEMADEHYRVSKTTVFLMNDPRELMDLLSRYGISYDFVPEKSRRLN